MTYELILTRTEGRVAVITLNRPKQLNALNDQLMDELGSALKAFDADDNIGCMILTGSEKAFAAGADIGAMATYGFADVYKGDYITRNWEQHPQHAQAGDRRRQRLCAGRRLRAGHDVRLHHCRRQRQIRPARNQAGHHPRRGRHAAPAARGRQGQGHGPGADRPHDGRGRSRTQRAGQPRGAAGQAAWTKPWARRCRSATTRRSP